MSWRVKNLTEEEERLAISRMIDPVYTIMNRTYKVEDYGKTPVVHVFARDQHRERVHEKIYGFSPYFYGGMEEMSELMWRTDPSFNIVSDILGRPNKKVVLELPKHTVKARKEFDYHCGANIYFEDRWYWDSGIRVTYKKDTNGELIPVDPDTVPIVPRRIMYIDIETLSSKEIPIEVVEVDPKYPIIMIQTLDNYTKETFIYYQESPYWKDYVPKNFEQGSMELPNGVIWPYRIVFVKCEDEKDLIRRFVERCEYCDPDDFTGWNINRFDWQKLHTNAKSLGIVETLRRVSPVQWYTIRSAKVEQESGRWKAYSGTVKLNGRSSVDLLDLYKQQTKPDGEEPGYTLKEVLARRLGLVYEELGPYMQDVWEDSRGRMRLFTYGALDVIGPYILNEGGPDLQGTDKDGVRYRCMNMWHQPEAVRRIAGCSFTDTFKKIRMLHPMLWRYVGKPIPTAKYGAREEETEKVGGGEVFDPIIGIHEWAGVVDFTAMYPTIIDSYNIGWDTLLTAEQVRDMDESEYVAVRFDYFGVERTMYFDLRFDSSLRILVRHLVSLRDQYRGRGKELLKGITDGISSEEDWYFNMLFEINAKFMANSVYGVNNYNGWPMFCPPAANAITGIGRDTIKWVAGKIEEEFSWLKVIYGDTDSLFLEVEAKDIEEAIARFSVAANRINELLEDRSKELGLVKPMEVKLEKIYNPIVFKGEFTLYKSGKTKFKRGTKKRYVGIEVYKDGEKRNREVWTGFEAKRSDAAPFLQKLQRKAGSILLRKRDTKAYVRYLRKWWVNLRKVPLNELAAPKGWKKHPTEYRPDSWKKAILYAMRVFGQPWIQQLKPGIVYIKPKGTPKKYRPEVPNCWKWKCYGSHDRGAKKKPGPISSYETDIKRPEKFVCPICGNPNAETEDYTIETITSLTGDFGDIPYDFWDEWEVDIKTMREKVLTNKFADMCLSIGENWSEVEGHTTLDSFFG